MPVKVTRSASMGAEFGGETHPVAGALVGAIAAGVLVGGFLPVAVGGALGWWLGGKFVTKLKS